MIRRQAVAEHQAQSLLFLCLGQFYQEPLPLQFNVGPLGHARTAQQGKRYQQELTHGESLAVA
jgi:hypothetical protein